MKKYLLLIISMVCTSIGAWAYDDITMQLHTPSDEGALKLYYFYEPDYPQINATGVTITMSSNTLVSGKSYGKVKITGPITSSDIDALNGIDAMILDLSEATLNGITSISNTKVKFLVLPNGSTHENLVNSTALAGCTKLLTAIESHNDNKEISITAYVHVAGTLQPAMAAAGLATTVGENFKINGHTAYYPNLNNNDGTLTYVTLSGNLIAYDICNMKQKVDNNGHFEWDSAASETVYDLVDPRKLVGTEVYGGLSGTQQLKELDMRDCYFSQCGDMTLSAQGANIAGNDLWKVVIPTDERVTETPAWFTCTNGIKEICIPSNIKVIRTHFAQSVDHIWTTAASGDISGTIYDNGAYKTKDSEPTLGYSKFTFSGLEPYGTYTLSSNLELIESNAFYNTTPHVKDVYVLAKEAPECHVDAFNTAMYVASGGYNPTITDGVITRDSYVNGSSWITMLHYPRECVTPNVQRYTDPTRKYTTASNERDGKGGVLYYPNFSEFLAAYAQGTTGYVWNAWSQEYEYGSLKESLTIGGNYWSADIQKQGNDTYLKNPKRSENPYTSFYDVTANGLYSQPTGLEPYSNIYWNEKILYTNGSDEDDHLYPAAETSEVYYNYIDANITTSEAFAAFKGTLYIKNGTSYEQVSNFTENTTYYKREQTQKTDSNGNKVYEPCSGGDYVAEDSYVKAANGGYVRNAVPIEGSYTAVTKEQEYVDTYYTDNADKKEVAIPKVKDDTYWYENGTKPVFSEYGTYQPISGVTQYYTRTGNSEPFTYTATTPTLNTTYYIPTGDKTNTYSAAVYSPVSGQNTYYKLENGVYTQEVPVLTTGNGTWYYNTGNTQQVNVFNTVYAAQENINTYYTTSDHTTPVLPTFNGTYYYKTGNTITVYEYNSVNYGNPVEDVTQYYTLSDGVYTTVDPVFNGDNYYTYDSSSNSYSKATSWHSGVTYYQKNNDETYSVLERDQIYFGGLYYYKTGNSSQEDEYLSTTQWQSGYNTYYTLNNNIYTVTLPQFNSGYDYVSNIETRPVYQSTSVFVPGFYNYYHTADGVTYYNYNEDCFSKDYYYVTGETDEYQATTAWNPSQTYYTENNGTYTKYTGSFQFDSQNYYYATGSTTRYDSANGEDWNAHDYFTDANGANPAETIEFDGTYYIQDYNYTYTKYNAETDGNKERWAKTTIYVAAETPGSGNYCPTMEDKEYRDVTKSHDYRGWHQFVLNAYAANTNDPVQPVRSYITDTDWWTICLPYDLTYNEMMLLYGDIQGNKVPQLCLLSNVVRDESRHHITLNFSSNLMEHKATKNTNGVWEVSTTEAPNHAVAKDTNHGGTADVVLHAGVPYLIKPTFANNNRQFDIYGGNNVNADLSAGRITATEAEYPGLFEKIAFSTTVNGKDFRELQEKNIYTVPALLPLNGDTYPSTNKENYIKNGDVAEVTTIGDKKYYRSADYDYTFVGSLAKAVIPPFSYFLGYTNKACFIYADYTTEKFAQNKKANTPDYANVMLWNNNSCVICPNMLKANSGLTTSQYYNLGKGSHNGLIDLATGKQAAQWKIYGESVTATLTDDLYHSSSVSSAATSAPMAMMFGMDMLNNSEGETTSIKVGGVEIMPTVKRIYSLNGQYVGDSLEGLAKGVYIVNGKKVMVK